METLLDSDYGFFFLMLLFKKLWSYMHEDVTFAPQIGWMDGWMDNPASRPEICQHGDMHVEMVKKSDITSSTTSVLYCCKTVDGQ